MIRRILVTVLCVGASSPVFGQINRDARFEILRTVLAEQAASRLALPFGNDGVEVFDTGEIDLEKLERNIQKEGASIQVDQVVTVTDISFDSDKLEIELDNGGKNKKSFWDRIEVGVGVGSRTASPNRDDPSKAKGSKVTLRFGKKVPPDLTPDQLKQLLDPVLDFNKRNFLKTGLESLPPEYQEAVRDKEARIGMDRSTVLMALGRPDKKVREKVDGVEREDWIYFQRGIRAQFVTFEQDVVIRIRQY